MIYNYILSTPSYMAVKYHLSGDHSNSIKAQTLTPALLTINNKHSALIVSLIVRRIHGGGDDQICDVITVHISGQHHSEII